MNEEDTAAINTLMGLGFEIRFREGQCAARGGAACHHLERTLNRHIVESGELPVLARYASSGGFGPVAEHHVDVWTG